MMKPLMLACLAGAPMLLMLASAPAFSSPAAPPSAAPPSATPRAPEQIYRTQCGYCHGHNVGPIIRGRRLPAQAIEHFVRHGNGAMPAFRPTELSDTELAALAAWVSASAADPKEFGQ